VSSDKCVTFSIEFRFSVSPITFFPKWIFRGTSSTASIPSAKTTVLLKMWLSGELEWMPVSYLHIALKIPQVILTTKSLRIAAGPNATEPGSLLIPSAYHMLALVV
jgi:hypothetical protein